MTVPAERHEVDGPRRASAISIPTVLASAGVAAVVSAIVVTIGVVGVASAGGFDARTTAAAATPTVVNLGAAQNSLAPAAQGASAPGSTTASAPASLPAAAPATEEVAASGGGAGTGTAPVAGATTAAPTAAAPAVTPSTATAVAAPAALTAGQLNTKIRLLMSTNASRAERASELQAGARGLGPVDAVATVLRVSGAGFTYEMIEPVTVSGTSMSATLKMSLVGQGSRTKVLTWVWAGDKWKLSDRSTCDVAGLALVPCSL